MKTLPLVLATLALAIPMFAADPTPQTAAPAATKTATVEPVLAVTTAVVSAPFVLKDGAISQPAQTEVAEGGKAIFTFTVPKDGDYVIHAIVNAPDEDSNSFFLNIDARPEDPLMICDLEVTQGFEERVVNWRGIGESGSGEFSPKVFKLTAGQHKLNVVGREPAQLKSVTIRAYAK
jgi:hypothetical protein